MCVCCADSANCRKNRMTEVHEVNSLSGGVRLVGDRAPKKINIYLSLTPRNTRKRTPLFLFLLVIFFLHPSDITETIIHDFDVR